MLIGFLFEDGERGVEALVLNVGQQTRTVDVHALFTITTAPLKLTQLYPKTRVDAATAMLNVSLLGHDVSIVSASASIALRPLCVSSLRAATRLQS